MLSKNGVAQGYMSLMTCDQNVRIFVEKYH